MASQELVGQLIAELGKLGYDINQMARSPRDPYSSGHRGKLRSQRDEIGNLIVTLSNKDPQPLLYNSVYGSLVQVRRAQGHYDTIFRTKDAPPFKGDVDNAVDTAIAMTKNL